MFSSQHDCDRVPQQTPLEVKRDQSQRISRSPERNSRVHHPDVFCLDGVCARSAAEYRDVGHDAPARCPRPGAGIPRRQQEALLAARLVFRRVLHRAGHHAGQKPVAVGLGGDGGAGTRGHSHHPLAQLECREGALGLHGSGVSLDCPAHGRLLAPPAA